MQFLVRKTVCPLAGALGCVAILLLANIDVANAQRPLNRKAMSVNGFAITQKYLTRLRCPEGPPRTVYFRIGGKTFAVRRKNFITGLFARLTLRKQKDGSLRNVAPAGAGCKNSPVHAARIIVVPNAMPSLKSVMIRATPGVKPAVPMVTRYIQHLGKQGSCKTTKFPQLIACYGSRNSGRKKIGLLFLVIKGKNGKVHLSKDKVPDFARCEAQRKKKLVCTIARRISPEVEIKTPFRLKDVSPQFILKVLRQLDQTARQLDVAKS